MGFPMEAADKTKHNYLQKCFYIINMMKEKDWDLWENFHAQYCATKPEESWDLYQILVEEYTKMVAPVKKKAVAAPKKKAVRRKAA